MSIAPSRFSSLVSLSSLSISPCAYLGHVRPRDVSPQLERRVLGAEHVEHLLAVLRQGRERDLDGFVRPRDGDEERAAFRRVDAVGAGRRRHGVYLRACVRACVSVSKRRRDQREAKAPMQSELTSTFYSTPTAKKTESNAFPSFCCCCSSSPRKAPACCPLRLARARRCASSCVGRARGRERRRQGEDECADRT